MDWVDVRYASTSIKLGFATLIITTQTSKKIFKKSTLFYSNNKKISEMGSQMAEV